MAQISIIMPVYNGAEYVARAIGAVQNQSFTDFELIVIDDGSIDDTKDVVQEFVSLDKRIKYYQQSKAGQFRARELGINLAMSDLITFMDADDWVAANWLSTVIPLMAKYDMVQIEHQVVNGVRPLQKQIGELTTIRHHDIIQSWLGDKTIDGFLWSKTFHRRTIVSVMNDIERPKFDFLEDVWLIHHVLPMIDHIACVSAPLYAYYQRVDSTVNGRVSLDKKRYGYELNKLMTAERINVPHFHQLCLVRRQRTLMKFLSSLTTLELKSEHVFLRQEINQHADGSGLAIADRVIWQMMRLGWLSTARHCRNSLLMAKAYLKQ